MRKVDYEKFPHQDSLAKVFASVPNVSACFIGLGAVANFGGKQVAIIAADMETLAEKFEELTGELLQKDGVQRLAIFSQDAVKPSPFQIRK